MIPKIVHCCWFGRAKLPWGARRCMRTWRRHLPDYRLMMWTEDNFDVNACAYVREAYEARKFAFVSDYARLCVLKRFGGIYLDTDVELLKPLDRFLEHDAFLCYESDAGCNTGLVGSVPDGRFVSDLLEEYVGEHFRLPDGQLDESPNVYRFAKVLKARGMRFAGSLETIPDYATIYPREYFCPRAWDSADCTLTENTCAIHHFAASWWSARNRWARWVKLQIGPCATRCVRRLRKSWKSCLARTR